MIKLSKETNFKWKWWIKKSQFEDDWSPLMILKSLKIIHLKFWVFLLLRVWSETTSSTLTGE